METVTTQGKTQQENAAITYPGFLAAALPLAKMGFLITALEPGGKKPILDNWPDTATTDINQLRRWAEVHPDANPGVVCLPDGVCILDEDVPGLAERYEKETGHLFPVTYSSKTRPNEDRYHYYFLQTSKSRALGNLTKKQTKLFDFQQNRKQCVGPGSYRKDLNGFYTVVNDEPPVPIPDELVDWLATFPRKEDIDSQSTSAASTPRSAEVVEDDGSPILEAGRRNSL